jgi:hypothetical protein
MKFTLFYWSTTDLQYNATSIKEADQASFHFLFFVGFLCHFLFFIFTGINETDQAFKKGKYIMFHNFTTPLRP